MEILKAGLFTTWAEQVIGQSPAVAAVARSEDRELPFASRVELATGAQVHVQWVGASPPRPVDPDNPVTGPPPAPVKLPDLGTSGRLRTGDIEQHLAALLNNAGHDQILDVTGYSVDPVLGSEEQRYGVRIRFHDESAVFGLFRHTLSAGQQASKATEFKQRDEL